MIMPRFLIIEPPVIYPKTRRPRASREKYSGGPNRRAKRASGGARNMRPTTLSVPATYEPIAAMARAAPARPFNARKDPHQGSDQAAYEGIEKVARQKSRGKTQKQILNGFSRYIPKPPRGRITRRRSLKTQ